MREERTTNSNCLQDMGTTAISSMTATLTVENANASASAVPQLLHQKLQSSYLAKVSGETFSSITFNTAGQKYAYKSEQPVERPNFMVDLKYYNLDSMTADQKTNKAEMWKHAEVNTKFYGVLPQSKRRRERKIQWTLRIIRTLQRHRITI